MTDRTELSTWSKLGKLEMPSKHASMARYLSNNLDKPTLSIDKPSLSIDNIGLSIDKPSYLLINLVIN